MAEGDVASFDAEAYRQRLAVMLSIDPGQIAIDVEAGSISIRAHIFLSDGEAEHIVELLQNVTHLQETSAHLGLSVISGAKLHHCLVCPLLVAPISMHLNSPTFLFSPFQSL